MFGVAYHISPAQVAEAKAYLDVREMNGYTIHQVPFYPADGQQPPISTMAYIGTPANPQFTGPQDPQALAEHICKSRGPSGENKDYLLRLEASLDELSPDSGDGHVKALAVKVRALDRARRSDGTTAEVDRRRGGFCMNDEERGVGYDA